MKIVINEPETQTVDGMFRVTYGIDDCGEFKELFYEVDERYADGVATERGDGVLVSLFLYAMRKHADIEVKVPGSERLLYQLQENIMDALNVEDPSWEKIKISCPVTSEPVQKNHDKPVVATGMSCGVDSLCAYYTHNVLNERYANHKINLLTFFNVGAFDYGDGKKLEGEYEAHRQLAFDFARDASGGGRIYQFWSLIPISRKSFPISMR